MKDTAATSESHVERIKLEAGEQDAWICICGNTPVDDGFYPCDRAGNEMEPLVGSNWESLYVCAQCGRIISLETLEIVGQNLNPKFLN